MSEILYSTYVGGRDGSSDGDISKMVRASGYQRIATGAGGKFIQIATGIFTIFLYLLPAIIKPSDSFYSILQSVQMLIGKWMALP